MEAEFLKLSAPNNSSELTAHGTGFLSASAFVSCGPQLKLGVRRQRHQDKNRRTISHIRRRLFLTGRNTLQGAGGNV